MINDLINHYKISKKLNLLIKKTSIGSQLYWYDSPISKVSGWRGFLKLLVYSMGSKKKDEIAENYQVKPLYYGNPLGDGLNNSGATVWNYTRLKNPPIVHGDKFCKILESNFETIIQEFQDNIDLITHHPDNKSLAKDGDWSGIFLYGVGGKVDPIIERHFKQTFKLLKEIPISKNFGFVLISKLSPGVHILPHCGSSNLRFRYHLGLDVPEPDKVKIRVGNRWENWETGKAFGFDDSFEHEVVHTGSKDRVVLIVDTWNPSLNEDEIKIFDDPLFNKFGKAS